MDPVGALVMFVGGLFLITAVYLQGNQVRRTNSRNWPIRTKPANVQSKTHKVRTHTKHKSVGQK